MSNKGPLLSLINVQSEDNVSRIIKEQFYVSGFIERTL